MSGFFLLIAKSAMLVFLVASMLELGLGLTLKQLLSPLKNVRLVLLSLFANFIVVPLLALLIAHLLRLETPFAIGLLLLALAPGAPFIPKIVQVARGDLAFSVGLMTLLMAGSVVWLPLVLPQILEGTEVRFGRIAGSLVFLMLLPLVAGMVLRARLRSLPVWLHPSLRWLTNLSVAVVVVITLSIHFRSVVRVFGTGAIFASLLLAGLSVWIGWLLGGKRATRTALALGSGLRNVAAALLVGSQNFRDPKVNVMVVVSAVTALLVVLPTASLLGRSQAKIHSPSNPVSNPLGSKRIL